MEDCLSDRYHRKECSDEGTAKTAIQEGLIMIECDKTTMQKVIGRVVKLENDVKLLKQKIAHYEMIKIGY